jgi:hypothetical protein
MYGQMIDQPLLMLKQEETKGREHSWQKRGSQSWIEDKLKGAKKDGNGYAHWFNLIYEGDCPPKVIIIRDWCRCYGL